MAGLPCADGVCRAGGIWRTGVPPKGNCASRNRRLTWQKAGVSRLVLDTPAFLFHAKSTVIESQCRSFHAARYEKHGQKSSLAMISVRIFCLSGHWGWYAKPYWVMAYSISSGLSARPNRLRLPTRCALLFHKPYDAPLSSRCCTDTADSVRRLLCKR